MQRRLYCELIGICEFTHLGRRLASFDYYLLWSQERSTDHKRNPLNRNLTPWHKSDTNRRCKRRWGKYAKVARASKSKEIHLQLEEWQESTRIDVCYLFICLCLYKLLRFLSIRWNLLRATSYPTLMWFRLWFSSVRSEGYLERILCVGLSIKSAVPSLYRPTTGVLVKVIFGRTFKLILAEDSSLQGHI